MGINIIELQGFGSYRYYTKIDFPSSGLVGIVGAYDVNPLKSNGSGKTTLISSVLYAFFGEGEFSRKDELVNDSISDEDMFVKVHASFSGNAYIIERGIRNNGSSYLEFKENGVSKGKSIQECNKAIIDVLGQDYDMLTASCFFEQGNIDKFINISPEPRRQYIDKVLGLEDWRKVLKLAIKKYKSSEVYITYLKKTIDDLQKECVSLETRLLPKNDVEKNVVILKKEIEDKRNILISLEQTSNYINDLARITHDIETKERSIQNKLDDYNIYTNNLNSLISEIDTITEDIILISNDKDSVSELQNNISTIENSIKELEKRNEDTVGKITFYKVEKSRINQIILNFEKMKKNLIEGVCPTCEQIITNVYVSEKQHEYDLNIENNKIIIDNNNKELDSLLKEQEKIYIDKSTAKESIKDLQDKIKIKESKKNILENNRKNLIAEFNLKTEAVDRLSTDINLFNTEIQNLILEKDKIKNKIPDGVDTQILGIKKGIFEKEKLLEDVTIQLGQFIELENSYKGLSITLNDTKESLKKGEKSLYIYNTLSNIFQEIISSIFEQSIDDIKTVSNNIIHQIIPEVSVNIYEDGSKQNKLIIDFDVNGKTRSYKRLSGGQQTIVNIGLRLGFSKVIKAWANTDVGFVVLDEPFGSLDKENRELVKRLLTKMLDWFEQVLVISHVESIDEFPYVILVKMAPEGYSYIEE
jgi:DNA repair exonuclease SbcCD ATPase subunit